MMGRAQTPADDLTVLVANPLGGHQFPAEWKSCPEIDAVH